MVITEDYRKLQQELHKNPEYGKASLFFAPLVKQILEFTQSKSISDYGAGKKVLWQALNRPENYYPYDPAFTEYGEPTQADLICCIDVLEHIEPDLIDNVLDDLKKLVVKYGFFTIHLGPAKKVLADGRNAHLLQMPVNWWEQKLMDRFTVLELEEHDICGRGLWVLVSPL
jgi:hypothetical protein